jgi:hypothetical protein
MSGIIQTDFLSSSNVVVKQPEPEQNEKYLPKYEIKELPSRFLPYPSDSKIWYEPVSLGFVLQSTQSKVSDEIRYKERLKRINCNFDKELLTVQDFLYICLMMDIGSFGDSTINMTFFCEHCGSEQTHRFKKSTIQFDDLGSEIDKDKKLPEFKLPVGLDFEGKRYNFTPLTLKDLFFLESLGKSDDLMAQWVVQCRNSVDKDGEPIVDPEKRFLALYDEISEYMYGESSHIILLEQLLNHGVKPLEVKCKIKDCQKPNNLKLEGGAIMFESFRGYSELISTKIHFG